MSVWCRGSAWFLLFCGVAISPGIVQATITPSIARQICEVYVKSPVSAAITEFGHPNPYESLLSKQFTQNLDRMAVPTFIMNEVDVPTIRTHVFDFQIAFMQHYFNQTPELKSLFEILYRKNASRKDVDRWVTENIPGYQLIWPDELQLLEKSTRQEIRELYRRVQDITKKSTLVGPSGFVDYLLYFRLINSKYIPIGNDHDLSVHLAQFASSRQRVIADQLSAKIVDEFESNADQLKRYSWSPEFPQRIDDLLSVWEAMQENRIIAIPDTDHFALMGGVFTAFSPSHLRGKSTESQFSAYRFLADRRPKIALNPQGADWEKIRLAFVRAGFPNFDLSDLHLVMSEMNNAYMKRASELHNLMQYRGNANIGTKLDDWMGGLRQMKTQKRVSERAYPDESYLHRLRIGDAAAQIFLLEEYQYALLGMMARDL